LVEKWLLVEIRAIREFPQAPLEISATKLIPSVNVLMGTLIVTLSG
jgi:hypothetical protein